jgi:hypothetical protein
MSKQRHFFATKEDLLPVFDTFEATQAVKYVLAGLLPAPELTTYSAGCHIATLGLSAPNANAINGYSYLASRPTERIEVRACRQNDDGVSYAVDQLLNPRTIVFMHGAFVGTDILLYGRVGTVSDDPVAVQLYRRFSSCLTKKFKRIRTFWVGPHASALHADGCRLTIGVDSPREFDLV